jgi:hypothetical protein
MEFNADILDNLERHEEDRSGFPVMHHPVHGPAPFPPPAEPVLEGPIDFTDFLQSDNIDEIFQGLDEIGEVNLPIVDHHLFDNIALASIYPHTDIPAPIIHAAISSELNTSFFKLVQCTQATSLVIFRTPAMCLIATNTAQIEIDWEGVHYMVSLAPHDMTDNRITLDKGYLVNLGIIDFPIEYWFKDFIAQAFYPFGSVIIIEQLCLAGTDFSALSLCLNIRQQWLPRHIMLNAGRIGMMFKLRIKGYIDLNNPPSHPPSSGSPSNPTPIHNPIQSMGVQSPRLQMVDNCFIPATIHTTAPTPPPLPQSGSPKSGWK